MDKETFFFTLFIIWYFKQNGPPQNLLLILVRLYHQTIECLNYYNYALYPDYFSNEIDTDTDMEKDTEKKKDKENDTDKEKENENKEKPKYEDKYLNEIRNLDKEFIFDKQDEEVQVNKFLELHSSLMKEEYYDKIKEFSDKLCKIEEILTKYESSDDDYCICGDEYEEYSYLGETKEGRIKFLLEEQMGLLRKKDDLKKEHETPEYQDNFIKKIKELSRDFVIKQRLEKLKNCYIIEYTPFGNVLMIYDTERESFKYYSDNTIPYRYLEVVGRKYVKQFNCRPIFVDMEEELLLAEGKIVKERKEKEEKDEENKKRKEEAIKNNKPIDEKKNVFTKFKSYNKEAGTGHVNTAAPPKNSISNIQTTKKQENEGIVLKERANRYTYEGKFANFSFTKKIDRKAVDKKFSMTFADFKKKMTLN
jgi:hypothetical protein